MPFYPDHVLDEIRNSIDIVPFISEHVALKKRGRNHVACCPFHNEKTPSFNVNAEKQIFMCFGCGVGGDVFKFAMLVEHVTFPEAVRLLAERYGIPLPQVARTEDASSGADLEALRAAMADAVTFYHHMLVDTAEGKGALAYLEGRGVTRQTMGRFQLGYSPAGGDVLLEWLRKKGHTPQTLEDCGLIKRSEDGRRQYDAFRGRIMFPITDARGRVIAFGGRAMGEAQPKYLNSPETRLYNKSRNLFGLSFSREGIKSSDLAILVEGYMDFLIPYQFGINNIVASLGTSLTAQQVKLLGRYTREVVVCYDPDSAGIAATQRSLDLFLDEDFRVKILQLPEGQDPDAFVRSVGVEEYRNRLRQVVSYLDFVLETAMHSQGKLDTPRSKVQVMNQVLPYLAKLPNAVERSEYVSRFASRLNIEDRLLLAEVRKAAQQRNRRLPDEPVAVVTSMKRGERRLLQLLLANPSLQAQILPLCSSQDFHGLATERIFAAIQERFRKSAVTTFEDLHRQFAGEAEQALLAQMQMEEVPEDHSPDTAESALNAIRKIRLDSYKQEIQSKIAEASQRSDDEMLARLMEQRIQVDRELISLSRK